MANSTHPFSDISWDDLRVFVACVEAGSFTDAAEALKIGQATVSRRVAALEEAVGHVLFDRGRSGLMPTAAARQLLPWALSMAAAARDAEAALSGLEATPSGRVRVTCPPGVAVDLMPPVLRWLRERAPDVVVEILADVRLRDIAAHEADIAIRNAAPTTGPLLVRKVCDVPVGLFGAPALVEALKGCAFDEVPLITWSEEVSSMASLFAGFPGKPVLITNDYLTMCAAAEAGLGIMGTTTVQAALHGLVPLPFPAEVMPPLPLAPFYLVTHQALRQVPRVQVVLEAIDEVVLGLIPNGRDAETSVGRGS